MPHYIEATKTLDLIEETIKADQGSSFRGWLQQVLPHIGDAYRQGEDDFRSHLGASVIGSECARAVWYGFRWYTKPSFSGRILRLFNRGHLEEARFIAMLLMIGCEVYQQDENGKQYRISASEGHFGGSGDGVVIGIPDLPPGTRALCEFKTSSDKYFKPVQQDGVRKAKFEHYVQMNIYMRLMGLTSALYMVVNKNTDELHAEIVHLDSATADQFLERGDRLVWMTTPPERISETPGWWQCRFCDHRPVCHLGAEPERNCRTCKYSTPVENGEWRCLRDNGIIGKDVQLVGCEHYCHET